MASQERPGRACPRACPWPPPRPPFRPSRRRDDSRSRPFHEFPLKVYLGWREILSGGVKIPKGFNKELSHAREYIFTDADEKQELSPSIFSPSQGYFLGLKEFFEAAAIPQGTSMTLEKTGPVQFNFWLKKSKKKIQVAKMTYDAEGDAFADAGETATLAMPNKIIYLERDQLQKLTALTPQREGLDLKGLLILIFKTFQLPVGQLFPPLPAGLPPGRRAPADDPGRRRAHPAQQPRIREIGQEEGDFLLPRNAFGTADRGGRGGRRPGRGRRRRDAGELTSDEFLEHEFTILEQAPPPKPPAARQDARRPAALAEAEAELEAFEEEKKAQGRERSRPPAPKKEKEKKKINIESDRRPKTRKSERRVKEEEIEELGIRTRSPLRRKRRRGRRARSSRPREPTPGAAEAPAEAAKPAGPGPLGAFGGGLFAEKLKVALKKKREEPAEDEDRNDRNDLIRRPVGPLFDMRRSPVKSSAFPPDPRSLRTLGPAAFDLPPVSAVRAGARGQANPTGRPAGSGSNSGSTPSNANIISPNSAWPGPSPGRAKPGLFST